MAVASHGNGWGGAVKSNLKVANSIVMDRHTDIGDVGIYLDDWSNNIEISGNTVAGWIGNAAGNVLMQSLKIIPLSIIICLKYFFEKFNSTSCG